MQEGRGKGVKCRKTDEEEVECKGMHAKDFPSLPKPMAFARMLHYAKQKYN